jgi:hypothetical protein
MTDHYECETCEERLDTILDIVRHDCEPVKLAAESLSQREQNTLLYVEARIVDNGGKLSLAQMNHEDQQNLKLMRAAGLLEFGEQKRDPDNPRDDVQFIESFSDEAFDIVRDCRQLRAYNDSRVDFPVGVDE